MTSYQQPLNPQHYTREHLQAIVPSWIQQVDVMECIDSTNSALKQAAPSHPHLLVAFHQNQGRGTQDRQFYCAPYQGLYVSFSYTQKCNFPLSLTMAAAITRALKNFHFDPTIKWVNDILIHDKKIGGILCETYAYGTIIGFGLNVSVENFPDHLKESAGSLHQFSEVLPTHLELIEEILKQFSILVQHPRLTQTWINQSLRFYQQSVKIIHFDNIIEGINQGINEQGQLMIQTKTGCQLFHSTVNTMTLL